MGRAGSSDAGGDAVAHSEDCRILWGATGFCFAATPGTFLDASCGPDIERSGASHNFHLFIRVELALLTQAKLLRLNVARN